MLRLLLIASLALSQIANAHDHHNQTINVEINEGKLVLGDILNHIPQVAKIIPSRGVARIAGEIVDIKSHKYELRLFYYEDTNDKLTLSFLDFCKSKDLLKLKSKIMNEGYGDIEFFSSRHIQDLKKEGIYFLLSMRKID